jgi:hypothetical protein
MVQITGTGGTFSAAADLLPTGATTSTFKYLLSASPCIADEEHRYS